MLLLFFRSRSTSSEALPGLGSGEAITSAHAWFTGEDKRIWFEVYGADGVTPIDITGWTLSWQLKRLRDAGPALIAKTTDAGISISGTFIASAAINRQRAIVTVTDDDTAGLPAGTYWHELKRTDADVEQVIAQGEAVLRPAVHP